MADTEDQWLIRQDGCLSLDTLIVDVTYNSLLNAIVLSCKDHSVIIVDALSGAVLQKSDLSGHKSDNLKCKYLSEKERTVLSDGSALGVRGDLQGILLLDTALQTPIQKAEETVRIELPLVEATHLLKAILVTDLSGKEYVDDFIKDLSNGIRDAQEATQGNHKTAKWATVCLEMQHIALKSACMSLIDELSKTGQKVQGLPVASAIVDRLAFLLPSCRADLLKEPVNRALMYSEAARRETFKNWPHMNYKWALPDPMAQAGFFHHPNLYGDDRAMCFTCNVCLVCWEPTDEPWSEHERHSQLCPYIKGDFTQNVPLALTYATQPAQFHGKSPQEKIACLSSTFNEDFIATSTKDGNVVVWDISHIAKKYCQFDIDVTDALVALKTGLQIEKQDSGSQQGSEKKCLDEDDEVQEISLHKTQPQNDHSQRPSDDMHVTALCVREAKCPEDAETSKCSTSGEYKLSVLCGVSLRRTKSSQNKDSHPVTGSSRTVQLMNEVNETVSSSESCVSRLITGGSESDSLCEFHVPESQLVPYIVVVSLVEQVQPLVEQGSSSPSKKKVSPVPVKAGPVKEDSITPPPNLANNSEEWPMPWEYDSDCQIVGFSLAPNKSSSSMPFIGTFASSADDTKQMTDQSNGPSDIFCDNLDSSLAEPITPTKPFSFSFANTSDSTTNSVANISESPKKEVSVISGNVVQCIELPKHFQKEGLEISYLIPSIDKQHLVVVLTTKVSFLESSSVPDPTVEVDGHQQEVKRQPDGMNVSPDYYCGGGILVYRLTNDGLEDSPMVQMAVSSPRDVITNALMLPMEIEDQVEEQSRNSGRRSRESAFSPGIVGHLVVTTASGVFKILSLSNLMVTTSLAPGPSEKFISSVYCSGIERLCVCSDNGKLYFFDLDTAGEELSRNVASTDLHDGNEAFQEGTPIKRAKMDEDMLDHSGSDYLTKQPMSPDTLSQLHSLTHFENLMPRFTAVVPPCWSEIQQEQQQRRHPQHLQQQGEATQHTRTWKLSAEAGQTWDEHLMEILLPKPCAVGHVDVKFTLNPLCTSQPNIEVTLLKQNIGSMHRAPGPLSSPSAAVGKSSSSYPKSSNGTAGSEETPQAESSTGTSENNQKADTANNVLDPKFLESLKAEILCGPIRLANCLDLTGSGGLITLTSSQLLNSKPRSLLLHIKGFENSPLVEPLLINKEKVDSHRSSLEKMIQKAKRKNLGVYKSMLDEKHHNIKDIKGIFDSVTQAASEKTSTTATSGKQKMSIIKGCDWFQELSVTVRVFRKLNICNEKLQRNSMIQDGSFHKRLLQQLLTSNPSGGLMTVSIEHVKNMALDVLIWILSVQSNDMKDRSNAEGLLQLVQGELAGIVTSCFILGSRTTAHKCSRLLVLCMECAKNASNGEVAPMLSQSILLALLSCFPLLPQCKSSGAMRWFFVILNRVKCMDIELVAEKTSEVLHGVSKQYSARTLSLQALLKTRYGLYGNPFEAELFDMEITGITKSSTTVTRGNPLSVCIKSGGATSAAGVGEQQGLFEMLTSSPDKALKNQPDCLRNDILGLLEVEPLHFRCHATSDGTRMERLDSSANAGGTGTGTSVINPTPSYLIPFQSLGGDEPVAGGGVGIGTGGGAGAGEMSSFFTQTNTAVSKLNVSSMPVFKNKKSSLGSKIYFGPSSKTQGGKLFQQLHLWKQQLASKPPPAPFSGPSASSSPSGPKQTAQPQAQQTQAKTAGQQQQTQAKQITLPQMHGLLQTPAPQVLIIERMHSGARRFVTLDFGKPIVLTDVVIPCSIDLASLSIDVWVEGEETDGQRLVVASDIGTRALVMNNIMPAPVCRYLKITTVGRYSGGTTRSRIRLGSFYGHTYILPWEWPDHPHVPSQRCPRMPPFSSPETSGSSDATNEDASAFAIKEMSSQASLLSQLGLFLSLMEDLQCRFNLARNRMESLLASASNIQHLSSHVQYHLRRSAMSKLSEEDGYIIQAYNECLQLQLQMNLAQRAIHRLQTSLGISTDSLDDSLDFNSSLIKAPTDKLRVILENLIDLLLTSTVGSPAIPQPPVSLYTALTPQGAESLFQHLCLHGSQRIHVSAGLLLVRVCGTQPWWGQFLGKMLQSFFHSRCSEIFPQDSVFVLLSSLGQKSLNGPSCQSILDSLLAMLASILQPLNQRQSGSNHAIGNLDLSLISWVLLFLCRNMDCSPQALSANSEDSEKGAKKDKEAGPLGNRWNFIDSQCCGANLSSSKVKANRLNRRGFQRKVALYRQRIHDFDKLKTSLSNAEKKSKLSAKALLKDVIDLHKLQSKGGDQQRVMDEDGDDRELEACLSMTRERCLSVVQGLVALILSMDFTCHVDLYLVACKVLSKICLACRPSITLGEATTQEQLEKLVLLVVGSEFNHDTLTWGGPWAGHAITCLLQDILEGEKICASTGDEGDSEANDQEILSYTQWLSREGVPWGNRKLKRHSIVVQSEQVEMCLRHKLEYYKYFKRDFLKGNICIDEKEDPALLVSLFVNKKDKDKWNKWLEAVTKYQACTNSTGGTNQTSPPPSGELPPDLMMEVAEPQEGAESQDTEEASWVDKALLDVGFQLIDSSSPSGSTLTVQEAGMEPEKMADYGLQSSVKLLKNGVLHNVISDLCAQAMSHGISQGVSTALDARLEYGLETLPEHRLKVIQSVQMNNIQCAFSSPLPSLPPVFTPHVSPATSDSYHDRSSDTASPPSASVSAEPARDLQNSNTASSLEMLNQCFELVFGQLCSRKVNLESALQLWLTLNEDQTSAEGSSSSAGGASVSGTSSFDATRQPVITLSENALSSLMEVGVLTPSLPVRIWVYLFQTLCLLTNQRQIGGAGRITETSLAPCVLNNPNLAPLLTKFLSGHSPMGSSSDGTQNYQVGPAAVKMFWDFLYRLECKSIEVDGRKFKEMLLKIVYNLTAERGAIYQGIGPIDAQVRFLEMLSENCPLNIDVSNALSVIQTATTLVHHHISFQEQVACRTSQNAALEARTCFGGLASCVLRGMDSNKPSGGDNLRNLLMFYLLQLVNKLILTSASNRGSGSTSSSGKGSMTLEAPGSWDALLAGSPSSVTWAESASVGQDLTGTRFSPRLLSTIRLSDDEKSRTRDQQLQDVGGGEEEEEISAEVSDLSPTSEIADIVVGNPVIMGSLIEALSYCSSAQLAFKLAQTDSLSVLQKAADQTEAVTVGGLIFTLLKNLQAKCSDRGAMVENLFKLFVGQASSWGQSPLTRISEPLLFFTLRTINSLGTVKKFYDLGGIEVVGGNFVRCNQQMISSSPSLISTLMQNLSSQAQADLADKAKGSEADLIEGLHNFAQLGTITSSSPTASPADGLIQPMANRRARSATWSYHFYPDEPCVELTIHLPFAVLLRYVHIKPHGGAISACPSYVSLELSHDGNIVSAVSPPMVSSSLSLIRLQLLKPEVVTAVTLILHKPKDSMGIGLQNISLWGQSAFSEGPEQVDSFLDEEAFSRSSLGWMRILHHCLVMSSEDTQGVLARAAAGIPHLMSTCTSLLVHPQIGLHAAKIETILIKIGLSDNEIGLTLLDNILGQSDSSGTHGCFLGKIQGMSSPFTVEILFRLGITQDANVQSRVEKLIQWLRECSRNAQEQHRTQQAASSSSSSFLNVVGGPMWNNTSMSPAPEHVQCVAAVLWHSAELPVSYPLQSLVPVHFIRSIFDWAMLLPDCKLRRAVTNVMCAACHLSTHGFIHIQEWMGIVDASGSQVVAPPVSVGVSDETVLAQRHDSLRDMRPGRMTDDSKGATSPSLYNQDGMTDDSKEACRLQSLNTMNLDEGKLLLLASACKSPAAMRQLMNSGLPSVLAQAVCEFCSHQMVLYTLIQGPGDGDADGEEVEGSDLGMDNPPTTGSNSVSSESGGTVTVSPSLVASILRFFTEISTELEVKEWLGQAEGNAFWSLLLSLLCGAQYQIPGISPAHPQWNKLISGDERSELENRTIQFFTSVISFHSENQLLFAKVLCDVIKDQGITKTDLLSAMPLSGFMRRLLLQVLLEDEKITVAVRVNGNGGSAAGGGGSNSCEEEPAGIGASESVCLPFSTSEDPLFHPRYGCGRSCQCISINFHSKISDVIAKVSDTVQMSSSWPEKKEEKKKRYADYKKEALGELDVEVLELIGTSAKEKREKSPLAKTGLPPRPPTRRGRQNGAVDGADLGVHGKGHSFSRAKLQHVALPGKDLPPGLTLAQLLQVLSEYALLPPAVALQFVLRIKTHSALFKDNSAETMASDETLLASPPFPSALKVFAGVGGLALLAEHLPLLFPEISRQSNNVELVADNNAADIGHDWVTVESSDELYDPYYYDSIPALQTAKSSKHPLVGLPPSIPPHSLVAFGLFLRLPGYAEVLLKERKTGQCLLRLVLGVTDDGDGGQILTSPIASSLPTMPFTVLQSLFDSSPLTTDDGVVLRRMSLDIGVVHLVLACLSTLSHHKPRAPLTSFQHETQLILSAMQSMSSLSSLNQPEEKGQQHYWAKGTGFGTGSTTSSWDAEQAMLRQKGEEEHVACLLQVLASYINPNTRKTTSGTPGDLSGESNNPGLPPSPPGDSNSPLTLTPNAKSAIPERLAELLSQSCLVPALSSYLRNDSVLDMARHVPLYRALLQLLRGIAFTPSLVAILLPMDKDGGGHQGNGNGESSAGGGGDSQASIEVLLEKMKRCVDTYASRLKSNKGKSGNKLEDEESEGLALLIPYIQKTAIHVRLATQELKALNDEGDHPDGASMEEQALKGQQTVDQRYMQVMKELQFDTFELVTEEGRNLKFNVSHHYESNVKAMGAVNNVARTRRLAQEAVTLSTSLPLAFSSSVFVRCDEERLDVMKVLITGPCDTPYANGCFEFDVFFPQDYPNSPPFINMETTGNHSVRFNPNLYNDGKVCLSVLNTWHGRPEEKWNAQTSSFLQVLVSIQSLILVSEPYFNEPGYERSRGTPSGAASSHEYDSNIRQATVKWAMLEQVKNPSPCFKEIVHTHFWLKRHEILMQCEQWIAEMETFSNDKRTGRSIAQSTLALKRHYNQMREEFSKLKPSAKLNIEEGDVMASQIDPEEKQYETQTPTADEARGMGPDSPHVPSASLFPVSVVAAGSVLNFSGGSGGEVVVPQNATVFPSGTITSTSSQSSALSSATSNDDLDTSPNPAAANLVAMSVLSAVLPDDMDPFTDSSNDNNNTLQDNGNPHC